MTPTTMALSAAGRQYLLACHVRAMQIANATCPRCHERLHAGGPPVPSLRVPRISICVACGADERARKPQRAIPGWEATCARVEEIVAVRAAAAAEAQREREEERAALRVETPPTLERRPRRLGLVLAAPPPVDTPEAP